MYSSGTRFNSETKYGTSLIYISNIILTIAHLLSSSTYLTSNKHWLKVMMQTTYFVIHGNKINIKIPYTKPGVSHYNISQCSRNYKTSDKAQLKHFF